MAGETRKHFVVGDRVRVNKGTKETSVDGCWVVEVKGAEVTVFDKRGREFITSPWHLLEFDKEILAYKQPSKRTFISEGFMRHDPNAKMIGQRVMVTGLHHRKGISGTIRETTRDGHALVELEVFNGQRPERIPFENLHYMTDNYLVELTTDPDAPQEIVSMPATLAPNPAASPPTVALGGYTPMHEAASSTSLLTPAWDPSSRTPGSCLTPAWDPSSCTPGPALLPTSDSPGPSSSSAGPSLPPSLSNPTWLRDPRMRRYDFKIFLRNLSTVRSFRMVGLGGDDMVEYRDGMKTKKCPLEDVICLQPESQWDIVVCIELGECFGQAFRFKTFDRQASKLRELKAKITKNETLYTFPTTSLAVIFPPK